jgi:molybdate transport system regulatory protein
MKKTTTHLAVALGHEVADKRIDILRRIGAVGSISRAAREAGISYKAAWQAIENMSNLAGTPLVSRAVGGSGGGGALLTQEGRRVLQAADMLAAARAQVLRQLELDAVAGAVEPSTRGLTLQTSMRNQLPCTVARLKADGASIRVELLLSGGIPLYARITRESAQLLDLHPGQSVLALCKATAVVIAKRIASKAGYTLLHGTVTRASRAKNGGEIGLRLAGDLHLVGFAEAGHGLKAGAAALASIAEHGVVIALSG